jgi:hypothetical protein
MNFECITTTTILFSNQSAGENDSIDNGRDSTSRVIRRDNYEKKDGNVENIQSICSHRSINKGIDASSTATIEYSNDNDDDDDGKDHTSNTSIRGNNINNRYHHNYDRHHYHHYHHHYYHHHTQRGSHQ